MGSGAPIGGGGDSSGGGGENFTESAMSTFLKSAASGLGKVALNALSFGGAKAFETGRKQQEQTRATLEQSLNDRASMGHMPEAEDYRNWKNAGGDDAAVAAIASKAHTVGQERVSAIEMLEQLHQNKVMSDQEYSMHAMALYSDDPTAAAMAKLGIQKQAQLAGITLKGQFAQGIATEREEGQNTRAKENIKSREGIAGRAQSGAMAREQSREGAALRVAKIHQLGKTSGLTAQTMKNFNNVTDVVGAANGDPAAMKKLLGTDAAEMTPDQQKAAFASANDKLAGTKGVSLERMAAGGAFMLTKTESGWTGSTTTAASAVGLPALIDSASKKDIGGITPEIAATFRQQWAAALKEQDPKKRAEMLDRAISTIPDPDTQQQIYAQLADMNESISAFRGADETETDDAMQMLNSPDEPAIGEDTSDSTGNE